MVAGMMSTAFVSRIFRAAGLFRRELASGWSSLISHTL